VNHSERETRKEEEGIMDTLLAITPLNVQIKIFVKEKFANSQ
jgi:hypothetical protein